MSKILKRRLSFVQICQTESGARAFSSRTELNVHKWTLHGILGANTTLDPTRKVVEYSEARSDIPEPERFAADADELVGISPVEVQEAGTSYQPSNDRSQSQQDLSRNETPSSSEWSGPALLDSDSGISVFEEKSAATAREGQSQIESMERETSPMQNQEITPRSLLEEEMIPGTEDDNSNSQAAIEIEHLIMSNEQKSDSELEVADYDSDATIFIPELAQWQHQPRRNPKSDSPDTWVEVMMLQNAPWAAGHDSERTSTEEILHACKSSAGRRSSGSQNSKRKVIASVGKLYSCEICSKTFAWSHRLKHHMRCHTGEKPYQCKFCTTAFARNDRLRLHIMRLHTGEKPYQCKFCAVQSVRQDSIMRHIRKLHAPEMALSGDIKPYTYAPEAQVPLHWCWGA